MIWASNLIGSHIKSTVYFEDDFNTHWAFQSYNYNVEGKFLHCFIQNFTMIFQNTEHFGKSYYLELHSFWNLLPIQNFRLEV